MSLVNLWNDPETDLENENGECGTFISAPKGGTWVNHFNKQILLVGCVKYNDIGQPALILHLNHHHIHFKKTRNARFQVSPPQN